MGRNSHVSTDLGHKLEASTDDNHPATAEDDEAVTGPYTGPLGSDWDELIRQIKKGQRRIYFYAVSGYDWQPLYRLTHLFDVFIYVDSRSTLEQFNAAWQQVANAQTPAGRGLRIPNTDEEAELANKVFQAPSYNWPGELGITVSGPTCGEWAVAEEPRFVSQQLHRAFRLKRRVGGRDRDVWFMFLRGNPLTAYRDIFIHHRIVPEGLAIGAPMHRPEAPAEFNQRVLQSWIKFGSWDGEFGGLLRAANAQMPRYLIADASLGWPVNPRRNIYGENNGVNVTEICTTGPYLCPPVTPAAAPGRRHVTLTRKPLTPQAAEGVDLVVLSEHTFASFNRKRWPAGTAYMMSAPPHAAHPDGPPAFLGIDHLDLLDKPLAKSLRQIELICVARNYKSVVIEGLMGFEDEAAELAHWRQKRGKIKRLVIHLGFQGHYLDYAEAADVLA